MPARPRSQDSVSYYWAYWDTWAISLWVQDVQDCDTNSPLGEFPEPVENFPDFVYDDSGITAKFSDDDPIEEVPANSRKRRFSASGLASPEASPTTGFPVHSEPRPADRRSSHCPATKRRKLVSVNPEKKTEHARSKFPPNVRSDVVDLGPAPGRIRDETPAAIRRHARVQTLLQEHWHNKDTVLSPPLCQ